MEGAITPLLGALVDIVRKQLKNLTRTMQHINDSVDEWPELIGLTNRAIALLYNRDQILQLQVDNYDVQEMVYIITNICYDAEDLVNEMNTVSMSEPANCRSARIFLLRNHKKISDLSKKLSEAVKNLEQHLQSVRDQLPRRGNIQRSLPPNPELFIGRDEDISKLVQELTSPEKHNSLGVTITGMNGIGKSALAYKVMNDAAVQARYPLILWVSLQGPFNPHEVIEELVNSYTRTRTFNHPLNRNEARERLIYKLRKSNWLIVLDNLLNVSSSEEWSNFWASLHHSPHWGKLVITTINCEVANTTKTSIRPLSPLPTLVCEQLISRMLENEWDNGAVSTISEKCLGFPRVANILARHLIHLKAVGQRDPLLMLCDRDLWEIQEFKSYMLPLLKTCYSMLEPHYVKKCFAYLSLFPRGYQFTREDLRSLWNGEDFLQCRSRSSPENVGDDYFQTLWKWSIFQRLNEGGDDEQPRYEIHKFIHMLAELISSKICLRLDKDTMSRPWDINIRHLSLLCKDEEVEGTPCWHDILALKGLRTFLPLCEINIKKTNLHTLLHNLIYIRVLSLSGSNVDDLTDSIKLLKLLRYLDLSKTRIKKLPNSICQLHNLQILKLKGCPNLISLPKKFKNLRSLRHIGWDLTDLKHLESMPPGIGNLTCLHTLPLFIIGKTEGYRITELKNMNRLEGWICIQNLENIQDWEEAAAAKLSSKTSLQRLELETSTGGNVGFDVITALEPPKSVEELHIVNYSHPEFPEWLSLLYRLKRLYVKGWKCYELSSACLRFPMALQSLTLQDMPMLHSWQQASDMPHLRHLVIKDCPNLTSLPSFEHLASLTELEISECELLGTLPMLSRSVKKLSITNCALQKDQCQIGAIQWPILRHVQTLVIDGENIPTSLTNDQQVHHTKPSRFQLSFGLWKKILAWR